MFEWRQDPCQFRDITDKVSLPKVTRNHTKPLSLKRKHTRKNRHASGLNENGSNMQQFIVDYKNTCVQRLEPIQEKSKTNPLSVNAYTASLSCQS